MYCKNCDKSFRNAAYRFCPICGNSMMERRPIRKQSVASHGKRNLNAWCDFIQDFVSDRELVNSFEFGDVPFGSIRIEAEKVYIR